MQHLQDNFYLLIRKILHHIFHKLHKYQRKYNQLLKHHQHMHQQLFQDLRIFNIQLHCNINNQQLQQHRQVFFHKHQQQSFSEYLHNSNIFQVQNIEHNFQCLSFLVNIQYSHQPYHKNKDAIYSNKHLFLNSTYLQTKNDLLYILCNSNSFLVYDV